MTNQLRFLHVIAYKPIVRPLIMITVTEERVGLLRPLFVDGEERSVDKHYSSGKGARLNDLCFASDDNVLPSHGWGGMYIRVLAPQLAVAGFATKNLPQLPHPVSVRVLLGQGLVQVPYLSASCAFKKEIQMSAFSMLRALDSPSSQARRNSSEGIPY